MDLAYAREARNLLVRDTCKMFFQAKGRRPVVQLDPIIQRAALLGKWVSDPSLSVLGSKVKITDWDRVTTAGLMTFDRKNNLIPFLMDKALAVTKRYAEQTYIHKEARPWKEKKVLLRFLLDAHPTERVLSHLIDYCHAFDSITNKLVIRK